MADVENPNPGGGGGGFVALAMKADPDVDESGCLLPFFVTSLAGVSLLPMFFFLYRAHRSSSSMAVRVVAGVLLLPGTFGFLMTACAFGMLLCGNYAGRHQDDDDDD